MKTLAIMTLLLLLTACSDKEAVPRNSIEGTLQVALAMGSFDPNRGSSFTQVISVELESGVYELIPDEGATIVGLEGQDLTFMSGSTIIIHGEINGAVFEADYIKFLNDGGDGNITIGDTESADAVAPMPSAELVERVEEVSPSDTVTESIIE